MNSGEIRGHPTGFVSSAFTGQPGRCCLGGAFAGVVEGGDAVFELAAPGLVFEGDGGWDDDVDLAPVAEFAAGLGLFAALDDVGADASAVAAARRFLHEGDGAGLLVGGAEFAGRAGRGTVRHDPPLRPPDQLELLGIGGGGFAPRETV